jgi:hypothetical protein
LGTSSALSKSWKSSLRQYMDSVAQGLEAHKELPFRLIGQHDIHIGIDGSPRIPIQRNSSSATMTSRSTMLWWILTPGTSRRSRQSWFGSRPASVRNDLSDASSRELVQVSPLRRRWTTQKSLSNSCYQCRKSSKRAEGSISGPSYSGAGFLLNLSSFSPQYFLPATWRS